LILLDLLLLGAFERRLVFRRDPPDVAEDRILDASAGTNSVLIGAAFKRHNRPLSGLLPQALAIFLGQLTECTEPAPRRRHEGVELLVPRIEQDDIIRELPWVARLATVVFFPLALVGAIELTALRRHEAFPDESHDLRDWVAIFPTDPTSS